MACTASEYINVFKKWIGYSEMNGKHQRIINLYNKQKHLPRGYKVKYTDEWCDTTISAAAIEADAVDIIGTECGVDRHIQIFKDMGIWIEDGTIKPQPGDIVVYSWKKTTQPNNAYGNHIGVVECVSNNQITAIEGNRMRCVARRVFPVGWGYIRGYARPKYRPEKQTRKKKITTIAKEVVSGKWGNGEARKKKIIAAGYDYDKVQEKVNELLRG